MGDTVIRIHNLGKKYRLRHQRSRQYVALRDVIAEQVKQAYKKLRSPFKQSTASTSFQEDFWALQNISCEIQQGDRVGIIGRNGAGKSTLLKILSRITEPTTGIIQMRGRVASLLEVGTGFHPELTGRENIYLNGAILGMGRHEIRKKFDEIVEFAEIEKFLDTPVKRYSSGMYVRLAFAVAAHLEPEILIIDEVLAVGDAAFQKKCLGKVQDVGREGRTVLFVSHNMGIMTQLCNKGIYLHQGTIQYNGGINEAIAHYLEQASSQDGIALLSPPEGTLSNKKVQFHQISIQDQEEHFLSDIDVRHPFRINVDYEILQPIENVELTIIIKTMHGQPVFTTHQSDCTPHSLQMRSPGRYQSTIIVPNLFLMPGTYSITVGAHEPMIEMFDLHENALAFRINETGTKLARYRDHHSNIGVVIIDLPWQERSMN